MASAAAPRVVRLYFDFISPYSWLALMQAEGFAARTGTAWDLRPVVYGALLDAHGLVGPVESTAKRRYTMQDIARLASHHGLRLAGPPAHPFRSLEALRTQWLFGADPRAVALARSMSDACWGEGRDLTDLRVIADLVERVGIDSRDLPERIAAPEVKAGLRRSTDEAIERGVFGVPTMIVGEELFWGHDRLPDLGRRLAGEPAPSASLVQRILARPAGITRGGRGPAT